MIRFKDVEILNRHRFTERNKESKVFPNKWGCIKKMHTPKWQLFIPVYPDGILWHSEGASTPPPSSPQRWYETLAEGWRPILQTSVVI